MERRLDVVSVNAKSGDLLHLEFENGEKRIFEMLLYMDKLPLPQMKDFILFAMATVEYGTVVWPGNIDLAPETLYDKSTPIQDQDTSPTTFTMREQPK